jgi:tetratricopeptide (TPR) repeat protein
MAAIHAQTGELEETQKILTELAEDASAGPTAVDARLQLAELKLLRGDREGSLAEANEVLRQDPANARGHALRGRLYMILGQAEEALSELRIARHDSPEDMGLAVLTARAHFALNNTLLGVEELRSFLAKKPDAMPIRMELAAHHQRQQESDMALSVLKDGLDHGNAVQLLVGMGDIETSREQYDAAEKYYRQAANQGKGQAFPLLRLGALQAERKNFSAARQTFTDLLQADPDVHAAAEGLVALDIAENHSEKALEWAKQRSESRPEDAPAADLFGRTALFLKKTDVAEEAFREAQRRAPNWAVPSARLADLYISTGRKDAALTESRAALERNPESIPEALLLGQLLQLTGEKAEAEEIYRDLLKRRPDLLPAANNLAYLLVSAEEPTAEQLSEAMTLAVKASAGGDPATQDTLAWVHYRSGDTDKALEILQQVHQKIPEDPSVAYHLAQVLADKGRIEEAKTLLKQIVDTEKMFPEAATARQLLEKL